MTTKAIILGAGMGKRMGTDLPKVLHTICNVPMINILLDAVKKTGIEDITVVIGPNMDNVKQAVEPVKTVVQTERLGTAHAVLAAEKEIQPFDGNVLILFGDQPLFLPETLNRMIKKCESGTDVAVLGFIPEDARRYGRLIMGEDGLDAIVEYKDATDVQRAIKLCNSGVMCVNGQHLLSLLKEIDNNNAAGEYYLTDIVSKAKNKGLKRDVVIGDAAELHGVNTPEELELAEEIYKKRMAQC
jgi:bifunctional UDP-N-acetylglucosamine pyrophosphorylase/glucosamine-1-phosphate N-acetyltransferase